VLARLRWVRGAASASSANQVLVAAPNDQPPILDPVQQREFALQIVRTLREAGYQAFFAGGCVRDLVMGCVPNDYDVATDALPGTIRRLFGRRRTLAVGAAFGVIVVVGPKPAGQVEVTTFRREANYADSRHPQSVDFGRASAGGRPSATEQRGGAPAINEPQGRAGVTPEEDVQRRDFTINGLLYDPLAHRVLDFVGGQDDIRRGIIRAIGDARARLSEDKLRMLRAVRFAARLGFTLEDQTRAAIAEMAPLITAISAERIAQEMRLILEHPSRSKAIELCRELGLLKAILPEVEVLHAASLGHWPHTLAVLGELQEPSFPLALAALLRAVPDVAAAAPRAPGLPEQFAASSRSRRVQKCGSVEEILAHGVGCRWRLSTDEVDRVAWLLVHRAALHGARQQPWSRLQRILIHPGIGDLIGLHEALARVDRTATADFEYCRQRLRLSPDLLNPPPLLTGDDLIAHGVPRGKVYQELLEAVRMAQLDGKVATREAALKLVDEILAQQGR
jgi:tRNA nucleotidyltransferase/poly(A) polymerase